MAPTDGNLGKGEPKKFGEFIIGEQQNQLPGVPLSDKPSTELECNTSMVTSLAMQEDDSEKSPSLREESTLKKSSENMDSRVRMSRTGSVVGECDSHALLNHRYILLPDNQFKKYWDCAQAVILITTAIIVPLRVGFSITSYGIAYCIDCIIDTYFWIDMGLNFITAFEDADNQNKLVTDPKLIFANYLKGWLIPDVLGCLPVDLATKIAEDTLLCSFSLDGCTTPSNNSGSLFRLFKLLRLFRLMKLLRLMRIGRLLERYEDELFEIQSVMDFSMLICVLIFLGHFVGCFFYFFSGTFWRSSTETERIEAGYISLWTDYFTENPEVATLSNRYLASMYWTFTTLTTVGYGDITCGTNMERVFAIVGMITGGFVFSAIIASMVSTLSTSSEEGQAYDDAVNGCTAFVKDYCFAKKLRVDVLLHVRHQNIPPYNRSELLGAMGARVRSEILQELFGTRLFLAAPVLKDSDRVYCEWIAMSMELRNFNRGAIIHVIGDIASGLYFIEKGAVHMLDSQNIEVDLLVSGDVFNEGEIGGLGMLCEYCIRAACYSNMYFVPKGEMVKMFQFFPKEKCKLVENYLTRTKCLPNDFASKTVDEEDVISQEPLDVPAMPSDAILQAVIKDRSRIEEHHMEEPDLYQLSSKLKNLQKEMAFVEEARNHLLKQQELNNQEARALMSQIVLSRAG